MEVDKSEIVPVLNKWGPDVRQLLQKLPDRVFAWAIFDTADHPADTYARGRVCLAGDAAHASSPFHGAGACMGVEDALVLVSALDTTLCSMSNGASKSKAEAISAAFQGYSAVRLKRSQWLVRSSRDMGDIYEWRYPATGNDAVKIKDEIESRSRILWDFDVGDMVAKVRAECQQGMKLNTT
ncbi:hypothetical protein J3459_018405 [Metarhizium acridum]|nr:hypothetical protein J3459_018405 [Metarhizium acridum]KAG8410202.1 hypothetical protein J3458_018238 [Metarhizium acridum]